MSDDDIDWRAGCACARAGLCLLCQAAERIEFLAAEANRRPRLSSKTVKELKRIASGGYGEMGISDLAKRILDETQGEQE